MPNQTLKRMIAMLCLSVALTACKEKVEIIEVVRAIKTMTVREQATEQIFRACRCRRLLRPQFSGQRAG